MTGCCTHWGVTNLFPKEAQWQHCQKSNSENLFSLWSESASLCERARSEDWLPTVDVHPGEGVPGLQGLLLERHGLVQKEVQQRQVWGRLCLGHGWLRVVNQDVWGWERCCFHIQSFNQILLIPARVRPGGHGSVQPLHHKVRGTNFGWPISVGEITTDLSFGPN